jgi:hypothetical protein
MSRAVADLPEDPAELRRFAAALASEVHAKTLLIEKLKMQLAMLRRARFGRSSEKLDRDIEQLELLIGDMEENDAERQAQSEAAGSGASSSVPKKPSVRAPLPDHLPLETIIRSQNSTSCSLGNGRKPLPKPSPHSHAWSSDHALMSAVNKIDEQLLATGSSVEGRLSRRGRDWI